MSVWDIMTNTKATATDKKFVAAAGSLANYSSQELMEWQTRLINVISTSSDAAQAVHRISLANDITIELRKRHPQYLR